MASGDTKTEALLNVLGNGGDASQYKGCCNTKAQSYILDAIDRIQNVEDEVEELKNNPDVVDIVDTYADLQAYNTQHLTENDVIRVLQDETHSGNSTYYRFTKNPDTWTFIGEISGGGDSVVQTLTPDDYNWNFDLQSQTEPYDSVALWLLPTGVYYIDNPEDTYLSVYSDVNGYGTQENGTTIVIKNPEVAGEVVEIIFYPPYSSEGSYGEMTDYSTGLPYNGTYENSSFFINLLFM